MKKYNKFLLVAGIGALSLTSCNLDVEPNDAVPGETTEALFTKKSIDYYLNGIINHIVLHSTETLYILQN